MESLDRVVASIPHLALPWERDRFLRSLIREIARVLEEVVGLEEASGFISVVGQRIGLEFNRDYTTALGVYWTNFTSPACTNRSWSRRRVRVARSTPDHLLGCV